MQTGKLTIKQVAVGERSTPKDQMLIIGEISPYLGYTLLLCTLS